MVAEFAMAKNYAQIEKLIAVISREFAASSDPNKRKGGLIGLAGISIGLGKDTDKFIKDLVNPILNCLTDTDTRVRYFASESLYNVVKVARSKSIPYIRYKRPFLYTFFKVPSYRCSRKYFLH
jgi:vacuole morphology and inheritance protein 14